MEKTPHKEKLTAALHNPKCSAEDRALLTEVLRYYEQWISAMRELTTRGPKRVRQMTGLLNEYKDRLEVDFIAKEGSPFIKKLS